MKSNVYISITMCIVLVLGNIQLYAQHNETGEHGSGSHHKNHLAIFNGVTTNLEHESSAYTMGIDYEFRFSSYIGLGILGESIFAEQNELIAGIPIFFHPCNNAKIITAPMLLFAEEIIEGSTETEMVSSFSLRIGAGYDFHIWKLSVGPSINFDFGEANAINYGLSIGFGF